MTHVTMYDIREWLQIGLEEDVTHMVVVCDAFNYKDYPRFVKPDENIDKVLEDINNQNMQKVVEIYSYAKNLESQIKESRSWNI